MYVTEQSARPHGNTVVEPNERYARGEINREKLGQIKAEVAKK
jgi:uncharacterized membrane protein